MREKITAYIILVRKPERDHLEDLSVERRILLKRKLNVMGRCGLNSCG